MEDNFKVQSPLPNATAVLVLGIVSIVTCWCYAIPGLVCAIIALVLGKSAKKLYRENPEDYTEGSYKNVKAGSICAWIGIALAILFVVYLIAIFAVIGVGALSDPQALKDLLGQ